mmetsp:Transcript_19095/g.64502  ORF Transcript_19095/g.64502 Transcript_19095/m.64502 type:complete len:316 (-) Transcript_19095:1087-2034(-)
MAPSPSLSNLANASARSPPPSSNARKTAANREATSFSDGARALRSSFTKAQSSPKSIELSPSWSSAFTKAWASARCKSAKTVPNFIKPENNSMAVIEPPPSASNLAKACLRLPPPSSNVMSSCANFCRAGSTPSPVRGVGFALGSPNSSASSSGVPTPPRREKSMIAAAVPKRCATCPHIPPCPPPHPAAFSAASNAAAASAGDGGFFMAFRQDSDHFAKDRPFFSEHCDLNNFKRAVSASPISGAPTCLTNSDAEMEPSPSTSYNFANATASTSDTSSNPGSARSPAASSNRVTSPDASASKWANASRASIPLV